ncbi:MULTISPECIES: response regulator [Shewanella]|jgi:two-component system response regulator CpxR|uniref:Two-component system response regulator n=1 Tax=Shewanella frigidimarina TaxID=56812 RepID=A0A119CZV7_SHEFR|nr:MULTISPECIES: response regulator [Shewanella]KVX01957.1 two-component system response regulator [Shewanella frigidimarina]MBB1360854.1 response regulator [Shewanella sp. SR44-4]MBB1426127.1 response regulator [Shewanella sp. SG44-2]MBO1897229.1 response regulator [Shewanella sp. BF02_Schw]PKH34403.1 DNA-binding response regulator [Shewanella sp. ALD9]|tara:strand:+ start:2770 stop:3456 length:687 start_codon:yes stop_codon:yes gene_type:complete
MNRILLIDDDIGLSDLLSQLLELEGFVLTQAYDGEQGLMMAQQQDFDLILLDVMLPKLNGFEVLRALRQRKQTPVLMLTARGDEIDRVVGLEIGADDYLPKPFNDRELVARIRAILRRAQTTQQDSQANEMMQFGDLRLDPTRQETYCNEQLIILTGTEFSLLFHLIEKSGELVTKESLSENVLGKKLMPFDRSLDMHLSNLRKKLPERQDGRPRVKTLRGKGYIWIP